MFSVEKFNDFTFGRRTVVHTDHKPLESIFMKPLHRAPKRLQGMLIRLQKYDLVVQYERGSRMFLADTLSRTYLLLGAQTESEFETINMMNYLPISEARLLQIQRETEQDESLQVLKAVIQHGWPENKSTVPLLASPYFDMRDELSVQDGLIFKGERVVVPEAARSGLLKSIHNSHLGVNGCLNRARECLYWPPATRQISPAQRLFSRRTRSLLPMTVALLKPSVSDEDVTHTKLHRRQQQQAEYYNRGARDLQLLEPGDTVRVKP